MAKSKNAGPLGRYLPGDDQLVCEDTRGPLGVRGQFTSRDSPGPLGINDWAEFLARNVSQSTPVAQAAKQIPPAAEVEPPPQPTPGGCGCNREITLAELRKVFTKQKKKVCETYLPHINATFKNYSVTTCLRKAHFLAQVGHESGELSYPAEELEKGKKEADVYDGYKGRGLIQITYGKNYKRYGEAAHHDFMLEHRTELEEPKWAVDSAGWYWTSGSSEDLNKLADKHDLLAITALVNGAFNGFDDRRKHLEAGVTTLGADKCKAAGIGTSKYRAFKDSEIYGNRIQAFAWGCWNDPKAGKKGVVMTVEERKQGYLRYLELLAELEKKNKKEPNGRYGFTTAKMKSLAEEGSK